MSKQGSAKKSKPWNKILLGIMLFIGIIIVASFVFLMTADFHIIALIFQLFIPYFLGPLLLHILPFIILVVGLIFAIRFAVSYKTRNKKAEDEQ